jgi:hypothetical protein
MMQHGACFDFTTQRCVNSVRESPGQPWRIKTGSLKSFARTLHGCRHLDECRRGFGAAPFTLVPHEPMPVYHSSPVAPPRKLGQMRSFEGEPSLCVLLSVSTRKRSETKRLAEFSGGSSYRADDVDIKDSRPDRSRTCGTRRYNWLEAHTGTPAQGVRATIVQRCLVRSA